MGIREDEVLMLPNIALLVSFLHNTLFRSGTICTKNLFLFYTSDQSIAQVVSEKPFFYRIPVNVVIEETNSHAIVKQTAKEFMFGYESPLTTLGYQFLPNWIYFDKVGLIDRVSN